MSSALAIALLSAWDRGPRAAMTVAKRVAGKLPASGTYAAFTGSEVISHPEAQKLMSIAR